MSEIKLVPFAEEHYEAYRQSFQHPAIRKALGSVDQEWLDYILTDSTGMEFAVLQDTCLVAVVGIALPDEHNHFYAVTNLAVKPDHFREGIGSSVLEQLLHQFDLEDEALWVSYVEPFNVHAQAFLKKNGWKRVGHEMGASNQHAELIRYEKNYRIST